MIVRSPNSTRRPIGKIKITTDALSELLGFDGKILSIKTDDSGRLATIIVESQQFVEDPPEYSIRNYNWRDALSFQSEHEYVQHLQQQIELVREIFKQERYAPI